MMSRTQKGLMSVAVAAAFGLPLLSAHAAPKKPAKPAPKKGGNAAAGKMTFSKEGCAGCHKTKDFPEAGEAGPDLSKVAGHETAAKIAAYIKKPKAGSIMPHYKGPQKNVDDMTAYLMTQK